MPGEKNLSALLKGMQPTLHQGEFVFCITSNAGEIPLTEIIGLFKEAEGYTVVVRKELADQYKLSYAFIAAWITLNVHSSLDAIGLTAAFSTALSAEGISCNIIAAYYHDHIFVAKQDAAKAMAVLGRFADSTI